MKYRIIQYIQPWEIDDFERQIHTMLLAKHYIQSDDIIIWDVTLNISDTIIDWNSSKLPKSFFVEKFKYLQKLVNQYYVAQFDTDDKILGCTDKRRSCQSKEHDFVIWLDSDIYFSHLTLPYLIISSKSVTTSCFMISPEIIKYWDSSWDSIVNKQFLAEPFNHRDYFDSYTIEHLIQTDDARLKSNPNIKFGGGWFNLFSADVFEKIPLPIELGSYASDDTYLMLCAKKYNLQQLVLTGIFVTEIGNRYLDGKDYLKNHLAITHKDRNRISEELFYKLVNKYYES
jgi:hypothetical protein